MVFGLPKCGLSKESCLGTRLKKSAGCLEGLPDVFAWSKLLTVRGWVLNFLRCITAGFSEAVHFKISAHCSILGELDEYECDSFHCKLCCCCVQFSIARH